MKGILLNITIVLLIAISTLSASAQNLHKEAKTFFKEGVYNKALDNYLKLYKTEFENIEINYNIGICYLNTDINKSAAVSYLEFVANQSKKDNFVYYYLGEAYRFAKEFDKAIESFQKFIRFNPKDKEMIIRANHNIEACTNAKKIIRKPLNVTLINLGNRINSKKSDYTPFISEDGSFLFFTTNRKYNSFLLSYYNNVYVSVYKRGNWTRSKSVGSKINTADDEILTGYNDNKNILSVFLNRWDIFDDVMLYKVRKTSARSIINPGENVNSKSIEASACLSVTGDSLFFASERNEGFGGLDIYMSKKLPNGIWGIPVNLGPTINTEYDENFPNISKNSKSLYFASNGHNTMGGFDIFVSKLNNASKEWKSPKNMGYPINDSYNNYTISFTNDNRHAYVSLNRNKGEGEFDIYKVIFNDKDPTISIYKGQVFAITPDTIPIANYNTDIQISVYLHNTKTLIGEYKINETNSDYLFALPPEKYDIKISHNDYENYSKKIIVHDEHKNQNRIKKRNIYLIKQNQIDETQY